MARIEIIAGDFSKGNHHQIIGRNLVMKVDGSFLREKIDLAQITELDVASEASVNRIGGAIGLGLAGEVLFGPIGLLAGLLRGGRRNEVTFVCKLRDGRKFLAVAPSSLFSIMNKALLKSNFESPAQISGYGNNTSSNAMTVRYKDRNENAPRTIPAKRGSLLRWPLVLVAFIIAIIGIAAIQTPPSQNVQSQATSTTPTIAQQPVTAPFTLQIHLTNNGGAKPSLNGTTNLPDGTRLTVDFKKVDGDLLGRSLVVVNNGTFQTDQYTNYGSPFQAGSYIVEVSSGLASLEPSSVQSIIGENGQNMKGNGVVQNSIDQTGGNVIDYTANLKIP